MTRQPRQFELLCPAGDQTAMRAAVANGADAVYFGLGQFNARARATNFPVEKLAATVDWLHGRNVKAYVAVNTLIFPDELELAARYVGAIAAVGADAVIVQDIGLASLVHRMAPSLPIHASTQMTLTEARGIRLASRLGVRRAILARELSLEDVRAIHLELTGKGTGTFSTEDVENEPVSFPMELEVLVHGAICISFSGQCLASESLWKRSGNRGLCAQACRLAYELLVDGRALPSKRGPYLLSPHDLAAHDRIAALMGAGVTGFKIEGRLKTEHYVAAATQAYRSAIDFGVRDSKSGSGQAPDPAVAPEQRLALEQTFSRGFCHGFIDGVNHQQLVDGASPTSRGVRLGTVTGRSRRGILVELANPEIPLAPGDGVVFAKAARGESLADSTGMPDDPQEPTGGRIYSIQRHEARARWPKPGTVELTFANEVDLFQVEAGDVAWKTDDPQLRRRLEASFARGEVYHAQPLRARLRAIVGEPTCLILTDPAGVQARAQSEQPAQKATRQPLTEQVAREQLSRLGGTPFVLGELELDAGADVMVPKSVLNDLRRQAVENIVALRRKYSIHQVVEPAALATLLTDAKACSRDVPPANVAGPRLLVRTMEQLGAAAKLDPATRPSLVYLDLPELDDVEPAIELLHAVGIPAGLATPRILMPSDQPILDRLARLAAMPAVTAVLVRNLGSLSFFADPNRSSASRAVHHALEIIADSSLNAANSLAVAALLRFGASRVSPCYDIQGGRTLALLRGVDPGDVEIVQHHHVPMFHTAHCIIAAGLTAGRDCRSCGRVCRRHDIRLRDRNAVEHPVRTDYAGRTTIFHARPQGSVNYMQAFRKAGVRHFRIELLNEDGREMEQLLGNSRQCLCPSSC